MKDWASARQRVQDLKAVDPRGSEKLNKEITGVSKHCKCLFLYTINFESKKLILLFHTRGYR